MTIELIGLPGSGKSHISALLAERLRNSGIPVSEPSRRIGHSRTLPRLAAKSACTLIFLLLHPIRTFRTALAVARTRQTSPKNLVKSLFNILFIRGLLVLFARKTRAVLLDQGLVQGCASVHFSASRQLPQGFLASLHAPDLVLRIRADRETVIRRLGERVLGAGSRVEADPAAQLSRYAEALESLSNRPPLEGARIIEIWNDGENKNLNEELDAIVKKLVKMHTSFI
ncbi:AAA family ATPase [Marispirochaeta sp.]|uniref:AAA family ATPase n=1 Tax=Marispirochaeta sp. TaxID=2038653 RepID=UPI0029C88946|nr:AAA family ATPase [Marispirochaeta sp.]